MADKLILKRKTITQKPHHGQYLVRIGASVYEKVIEATQETGRSVKSIVDELIGFAYDRIEYEDSGSVEDEEE